MKLRTIKGTPPNNTKSLVKLSTVMGVVVLVGITTPLWHIWADKTSREEFVGFTNFYLFIYAFGSYFASFCFASYVFWIKNFIAPQYRKVVKVTNIISGVLLAISTYFLIWVLNPYDDFPKYVYHIVFALSAIFIAYGIYLLNNFIAGIVLRQDHNTNNLISFIFRVRNKHYKRVAMKAMYAQEYREPLLSDDSVEDNTTEFEDDFYETLDKVDTHY